jgi:hypothetical protein
VRVVGRASHQKSGQPEWNGNGKGEAQARLSHDEACPAYQQQEGLGREELFAQVFSRENRVVAWKRVKAKKKGVRGSMGDQSTKRWNISRNTGRESGRNYSLANIGPKPYAGSRFRNRVEASGN